MYSLILFEYSPTRSCLSGSQSVNPLDRITYRVRISPKSPNPFVALLLRGALHNFSAAAPVTPLNGIAYRRIRQNTRKSNAALLLPHLVAVSPLLRYSYKKMGGGGYPTPGKPQGAAKYQCYLPLTKTLANAPKIPQCFLPLTDHLSRNYQCYLPLTKKPGNYPLTSSTDSGTLLV